MWFIILSACAPSADFSPPDPGEIVNRWWHFRDADMDVYLQLTLEAGLCGSTWYSSYPPIADPPEKNLDGGTWCTVDYRKFWMNWSGSEYAFRIDEAPDGCWVVSVPFHSDVACLVDE